ncbi:MAG: pyruvate kinase [Candidatus Jacksonbacteria bacterium]|nr:pyruvate kinase [Candidatus Jacksonbacteria bacterium]
MNKNTKIVCTIGPASDEGKVIDQLIRNGMNIARLNFSHGTHAQHATLIKNIRAASKRTKKPIAILQDLQGPRIRIGVLAEPVKIVRNDKVILIPESQFEDVLNHSERKFLPVQYEELYKDVKKGSTILIDEGFIELTVQRIVGDQIVTKVITSGEVKSNKGINTPGLELSADPLTKKDREDVRFGVENDVDAIALSFVASAEDMATLRKEVQRRVKKGAIPALIAKIERQSAMDDLEDIVEESDGVMVARGDLALETSAAEVPVMQKKIIGECARQGKPVIVATQMLDSMIQNPRPTRAEVSDVSNAVVDHADCVMLSGETASGEYPVEAVGMMNSIIEETEASPYDDVSPVSSHNITWSLADRNAIAEAAVDIAFTEDAAAIVVTSLTGATVRAVVRLRPQIPILGLVPNETIQRKLLFSWGVRPIVIGKCENVDGLIKESTKALAKEKLTQKGDKVVLVAGQQVGTTGTTNFVQVQEL